MEKATSKIPTQTLTKLSDPVARGAKHALRTPPRLVSDQLINIFFQEWAPLYPVVHRPTILKAYEQYLNNVDSLKQDLPVMAQLNLIFGIAALSSNVSTVTICIQKSCAKQQQSRTNQDPEFFEENWTGTLDMLLGESSISGLQCFLLAQIYCMTKGDYRSLLRYRALAVDVCHQLGLYEAQEQTTSNPLEGETRKKVFWCQYVLDRYANPRIQIPALY